VAVASISIHQQEPPENQRLSPLLSADDCWCLPVELAQNWYSGVSGRRLASDDLVILLSANTVSILEGAVLLLFCMMLKHGLRFSVVGGVIGLLIGVLWAMYYSVTTGIDGGNIPAFTIPIGVLFGCFGGLAFGAWKWLQQRRSRHTEEQL
jgi:hypothetical protein